MTVSFSPFCKSALERCSASLAVSRALAMLLAFAMAIACPPAAAQNKSAAVDFVYNEIVPMDNHFIVNAQIAATPHPRLEELIHGGVAIPFMAEFVLSRPRWYWWDETIVERVLEFRLSYHALTRQYRLAVGSLHRSFGTYEEALGAMLSIRNWVVAERGQLRVNESYNAALRFRLEVAQLPKPFQVAALGSRELDLSTGWVNWTFLVSPR